MTDLTKPPQDLIQRARSFALASDEDLKQTAARAARDRDAETLWAITEAHLMLHGAAGSNVSVHTLDTYKRAVRQLIEAWSHEALLRPSRNAGALYLRELEVKYKPKTVGVKLAAGKALYAALRWTGVTDVSPFADSKPARDTTPDWERREAYSQSEVDWLLKCASSVNRLILLLGAHAGLRVSEMTALRWEDLNLENASLKVRKGKGGKAGTVYLSPSLVAELEKAPLDEREGFVLPCRSRQVVSERLKSLCREARVRFRGVHALRHAVGTRMYHETGDLALVADHLRHANLQTTRGYAKRANQQLKDAVRKW